MSLRSFEALMLQEAREVVGKRGLRQKDIQEWSTSEVEPRADERAFRLPRNGVWIAVKRDALPKNGSAPSDKAAANREDEHG